MKKIYIILMHTNTIPSRIVKLFTRYEYSHVAISLEKSCNILYSFGRKSLKNPLIGGFTSEHKNGDFFTFFNNTKCKIYEAQITTNQYTDIEQSLKIMNKNSDIYKYDFLGIVFRFFNIPLTFKNKYVCSNFVAHVLEKNGVCTFNKRTCLVKPKDFESIAGFKLIYSGLYNLYN